MAKNKRPKFLDKETPELLAMLKEILADDEADTKKALKIAEELEARQPSESGPLSVDEALKAAADKMSEALNSIKAAYDNEVSMMEDTGDEASEDDEEEEEAPPKKAKKEKKEKASKKGKKAKKDEPEEDEDEDEEEDSDEVEDSDEEDPDEAEGSDGEDGEDYSEWPTKDLKKECRTRGIKVTKGMSKADLVKALEADDKD